MKTCRTHSPRLMQTGFTLFEVLIAIVIIAVGLLGLAGMQATSLRINSSSYHRSQATVLAYDIADRMRANVSSIDSYLVTVVTDEEIIAGLAGCKTTGGCTTSQMAQNDVLEWHAALTSTLPGGTGSISVAGDVYTVSISWDDNRDSSVDGSDPNFRISFQP